MSPRRYGPTVDQRDEPPARCRLNLAAIQDEFAEFLGFFYAAFVAPRHRDPHCRQGEHAGIGACRFRADLAFFLREENMKAAVRSVLSAVIVSSAVLGR